MPVMVLSKGTAFKRLTLSLGVCLLISATTGCSVATLDQVRPEVNSLQGMVLVPGGIESINNLASDNGTGQEDSSGSGIVSGGTGAGSDTGGTVVGNSTKFAALPYNVVCARDYSTYLDKYVYLPISQKLDQLYGDASNNLYFRVFHTGYDSYSEDPNSIVRAAPYDSRRVGTLSDLAGTGVSDFALSWLIDLHGNRKGVSAAKNNWLNKIDKSALVPQSTWVQASTDSAVDKLLLQLWGNPRLGADTLQDYLGSVRRSVIGTVPHIKLNLRSSATSSVYITLTDPNPSDIRYTDHISKESTDRLFGYYNQYPDRNASPIEFCVEDDYTMLYAYVDGYSKTIVLLNAAPGYTLDQLLGEHRAFIASKISSMYNNTEWAKVASLVENATILQKGVRGLD